MLYKEVSLREFKQAFKDMNRDQFSNKGYEVVYNDLMSSFFDIELDVIAILSDYEEGNLEEVFEYYDLESLEELEENTRVIATFDDKVVFIPF